MVCSLVRRGLAAILCVLQKYATKPGGKTAAKRRRPIVRYCLQTKGELRMGLIDLFQKTRETSMEMKPQEDEAAKVVTCKGCGAELKA